MSDYNGWTNYATWKINLEYFDGVTADDIGGKTLSDTASAARAWVEDAITESGAPAHVADLALAFIADVDWYEIADHLIQSENVA
jgi:hypothetical protein